MTKKLLMGNEAMAHAALEAGVGVVAGYPGTPSSEIVETIARQHARGAAHGVHVEWSTNEKVALELLFGASLAGKRGLFTCKQMGLNVASDALMSLNYVSVRAGLVLVVADDPGPISSQTEQDTRRFAAFAKVPVLDPANPEQAYDMVKAAFDLSERFHTPVIVRPTTRIDHASAFLDVLEETTARAPLLSPSASGSIVARNRSDAEEADSTTAFSSGFMYDSDRWVIFPKRAYEAHGEINDRLREIAGVFSTNPAFSRFNPIDEVAASDPPRQSNVRTHIRVETPATPQTPTFGILASGVSAAYAREALRMITERSHEAGVRTPAYRFMQVGTPYPFPEAAIAEFTKGLAEVLVLEELDYVLEDELVRFAGRAHATFNVHGKLTGEARERGENDVDDIMTRIERFLGLTGRLSLHRLRDEIRSSALVGGAVPEVRLTDEEAASLPKRPPVLCAGCPHRGAFYAVKLALGDTPAVMCGDIGCYTLGNAAPLDAVDTCLCMGGGVTMAQGIAVADPGKKAIAYIGDSTFFASGMTGLTNAAYNGHNITVMVLDNATTAMTGSQPHPGTGYTLMGGRSEPLSIHAVLNGCGFAHVYHANPFDRDQSVMSVRAALAYEGPSAVIFEGPCAQIAPPDPAPAVDTEQCTGCKRCITSIGCPALSFNSHVTGPRSRDRGQAVVDTSLCVGCNLCVQTCPFKAIIPNLGDAAAEYDPAYIPPTTLASGSTQVSKPKSSAADSRDSSGKTAMASPATSGQISPTSAPGEVTPPSASGAVSLPSASGAIASPVSSGEVTPPSEPASLPPSSASGPLSSSASGPLPSMSSSASGSLPLTPSSDRFVPPTKTGPFRAAPSISEAFDLTPAPSTSAQFAYAQEGGEGADFNRSDTSDALEVASAYDDASEPLSDSDYNEPTHEPAYGSAHEPAHETEYNPARDHAYEPAFEPAREQTREPAREPAYEQAYEPARESTYEPARGSVPELEQPPQLDLDYGAEKVDDFPLSTASDEELWANLEARIEEGDSDES